MPLSRRYHPEMWPGEQSVFGMDFSTVIPPGVGVQSVTLIIQTNTNPPVATDATDFIIGTVNWSDRTVYATIKSLGPTSGKDYILIWTVNDTDGNLWIRAGLILVTYTS
jgi:hypothetical protein